MKKQSDNYNGIM